MTLGNNAFARLLAVGVAIAVHVAITYWLLHGARSATRQPDAQRTFFVARIIDSRPRPAHVSGAQDARQFSRSPEPRPPARARKARRVPDEQARATSTAAVKPQPIRTENVVVAPSPATEPNATQPTLRVDQRAIQAAAAAAVRGSPLALSAAASEQPTLPSKVERAVASSGRRDCKDVYPGAGLLALPLILVDTAREKCRW